MPVFGVILARIFPIWTEYVEALRCFHSVRMRKNTDQNNSEYLHFLRNVKVYAIFPLPQRFTEGTWYKKGALDHT